MIPLQIPAAQPLSGQATRESELSGAAVSAKRFYDPVDVVLIFRTPDGIARTLHHGVYQTIADAQEAISDVTAWAQDGQGRLLSECGRYRIQPVST